jgi:hypothetical protein
MHHSIILHVMLHLIKSIHSHRLHQHINLRRDPLSRASRELFSLVGTERLGLFLVFASTFVAQGGGIGPDRSQCKFTCHGLHDSNAHGTFTCYDSYHGITAQMHSVNLVLTATLNLTPSSTLKWFPPMLTTPISISDSCPVPPPLSLFGLLPFPLGPPFPSRSYVVRSPTPAFCKVRSLWEKFEGTRVCSTR